MSTSLPEINFRRSFLLISFFEEILSLGFSMYIFAFLCFLACAFISFSLERATKQAISYFSLFFSITSKEDFPTDPVDPSITTFCIKLGYKK